MVRIYFWSKWILATSFYWHILYMCALEYLNGVNVSLLFNILIGIKDNGNGWC